MSSPGYFFAMFGKPRPPAKDRVESGVYHPNPKTAPFPTQPGDFLLLYCTGNYTEHTLSIPGVGVVLDQDNETIKYRYIPFAQPIPKQKIDGAFMPDDLTKFHNIRFNTFWLFPISRRAFVATVGTPEIAWP